MNTSPTPTVGTAWNALDTKAPSNPAVAPSTAPETVVQSSALFKGQRSIDIAHNGAIYRLQSTRQGKLILTK